MASEIVSISKNQSNDEQNDSQKKCRTKANKKRTEERIILASKKRHNQKEECQFSNAGRL